MNYDKRYVVAQAGIILSKLHAELAAHGLAMINLGSISDQTLAGVVTTATHGTGIDQPEAEMAVDFSPLAQLVNSLYSGSYKLFFQALALVEERFLTQDRYLLEHKAWFIREMRLRAYQQLLQSYRVVGLESMANDFGVTVDFLDRYVFFPSFYLHPNPDPARGSL